MTHLHVLSRRLSYPFKVEVVENHHVITGPLVFLGGILGYKDDVVTRGLGGDISSILWGDNKGQARECLQGLKDPYNPKEGGHH